MEKKDKLLLIDDSRLVLQSLAGILGKEFEIFALTDGSGAVSMVKMLKPSLVLLDIIMPRLSGFDVIKMLKSEPDIAEIPVIFITGLTNEEDEERGFELGAVDYITKPFSAHTVHTRVKTNVKLYNNKIQLKKEQEYSQMLFGLTDDCLFDHDIRESKIKYSKNFCERFQIPEVLSNYPYSLIDTGIIPDYYTDTIVQYAIDAQKGIASGHNSELSLRLPDGTPVWYSLHYNILKDESGVPSRVVGKMTDITQQKQHMSELLMRAETDPLTGLFNKEETRQRIERSLAFSASGVKSALIIVDIDNFKGVNDSLGHQFGDAVLVDISGKIRKLFRSGDIVGRLGGDEFMVFLENIPNEGMVHKKAEALCEAFRNTYTGVDNQYKISGSIGIALFPQHGSTFDALYHVADIALYESKHKGKDCYTLYSDSIEHTKKAETAVADNAERLEASFFAEDISHTIFQMLYETKDLHATITMVLEIIGKKFHADHCYIYEAGSGSDAAANTYFWSSDESANSKFALWQISSNELNYIYSNSNADGIFRCSDLSNYVYPDGISRFSGETKSFILCVIRSMGEPIGFIGFSDCKQVREWSVEETANFGYIAKIISMFLVRKCLL